MNRTSVAWLALLSLPLLVGGCVRADARAPIGQSTTTGGVLCPEGQAPSEDGRFCVLAESPAQSPEFQSP